jgi:hypothetical protein
VRARKQKCYICYLDAVAKPVVDVQFTSCLFWLCIERKRGKTVVPVPGTISVLDPAPVEHANCTIILFALCNLVSPRYFGNTFLPLEKYLATLYLEPGPALDPASETQSGRRLVFYYSNIMSADPRQLLALLKTCSKNLKIYFLKEETLV